MGVDIELRRRHVRASIHEVAISWWRKPGDEYRAAMKERNRSNVGRMARFRGKVRDPTEYVYGQLRTLCDAVDICSGNRTLHAIARWNWIISVNY